VGTQRRLVLSDTAETAEVQRDALRSRIIEATFGVLMREGYARASTREIAKQAKVSKRELYALFGSKQGILAAMVEGRAARMRLPLALPAVEDRPALEEALVGFGVTLVRELCHPAVASLFRLAVAEAERSPELAHLIDARGRKPTRTALTEFIARAEAGGLIGGAAPVAIAAQFLGLLWGDLQMSLLMRLADMPEPSEMERRARAAASAVLALYPGAGC